MRAMLRAAAFVLVSALALPARAGDEPEQVEAEQHAAEGKRLLEIGRFGEALAVLRLAYRGNNDANLLMDMGDCQRKMGRCKDAIYSYERYLASALIATRRTEAEASIAACKAELERAERERPPPAADRPRGLAPAPSSDLPNAGPAQREVSPDPPRRAAFIDLAKVPKVMRHWWFWAAVGAVAVVAVSISLGVVYGGEKEPPHPGDSAGSIKVQF